MFLSHFFACTRRCTFLTGEVRNPPSSGKDIVESKGVYREMESEGSWILGKNNNQWETSGLTNRDYIRGYT